MLELTRLRWLVLLSFCRLLILPACSCEMQHRVASRHRTVGGPALMPPPSLSPSLRPDAAATRRLGQRFAVGVVGGALCNDALLLLMLVPMLPALLPSASPLRLACLFSSKDLCQLVCAPLAGALTLEVGAQNSLTASLLLLALSTVAFAEAQSFRGLLGARALQGAASAALMSGGLTLVAESHDPGLRNEAIARAQTGLGVGATLGPCLGGLLLAAIGRRLTFYVAAVLVLLNGVAALGLRFLMPPPELLLERKQVLRERPSRQLVHLVRDRNVRVVALSIFAQYAAGGCFDAVFGIHLHETFGSGPAEASLIFSLEPVTYLVTMALLSPRIGGIRKSRCSMFGVGLIALSLPCLTAGGRRAAVTLATVFHGVGYGFKDCASHGLLAEAVERSGIGSFAMAFALADVADSLGYVLGPPLGSALCHLLGRTPGLGLFAAAVATILPALSSVPG